MKQVVIENPVINSAFKEPSRLFLFTDDGITDEIVEPRRTNAYLVPIAPPKKKRETGNSRTLPTVSENTWVQPIKEAVKP